MDPLSDAGVIVSGLTIAVVIVAGIDLGVAWLVRGLRGASGDD